MIRIDPAQADRPLPLAWTGPLVRARLGKAYDIDRRLPGSRRGSSSWLFATLDTFADLVGRDHREPLRISGATAEDIALMDEAFAWLRILAGYPDEQRALAAWSACSGSIARMLARRNIARATFYRHAFTGAERIATVLNKRGVKVR
jgi:hypothetical protein